MSAADARPTAPGNLPMGMPLPSSGDIKTVPLSMPPVPATCGVTGAAVLRPEEAVLLSSRRLSEWLWGPAPPASGSPARAGAGFRLARASARPCRPERAQGLASSLSREGWVSWHRRPAATGLRRAAAGCWRCRALLCGRGGAQKQNCARRCRQPQLQAFHIAAPRAAVALIVLSLLRTRPCDTACLARSATPSDRQETTLSTDSTLASNSPTWAHASDRRSDREFFPTVVASGTGCISSRTAEARNEEAGSGVSGAGLVEVSRRSGGKLRT